MIRQQAILPCFVSRDLGHGRLEKRKVYVLEDLSFIEAKQDWVGLQSVVLEREVWRNEKQTTSKQFYISSLTGVGSEKMGGYVRNHWAIENGLHWQLYVTFKEDKSVIRVENEIINFHLIRKWALHLLKKDLSKISLRRKRKKARGNNQYLKQLFSY